MPSNAATSSRNSKLRDWLSKNLILTIWSLLAAAVLIWMMTTGNISRQITVEAGSASVDANAFIKNQGSVTATFVSDLSVVDLNQPGRYPVQIRAGLFTYRRILKVQDTVSPVATPVPVTAVSVSMPQPEAFVAQIQDVTPVTVTYAVIPDMQAEGDQEVELILSDTSGNVTTLRSTLTVLVDRQAPAIEGVKPLRAYLNQIPDYTGHIVVSDNLDAMPVLTVDDSRVNLTKAGTYPVTYCAVDTSGNTTTASTTIAVIFDNTPPAIFGVHDISVYAGSTVSYRSGIKVEDDTDASAKLTIDSSKVDLSQPGIYEVSYTATDAAGNTATVSATVTVAEKRSGYVEAEVIYAAADEILAKIITEIMTSEEKIKAVHKYVCSHYFYAGHTDKNDWQQAAYQMMTTRDGNCYSFFAVSKLFFDRLGIPNMMVSRELTIYRSANHYWNLVSVDSGETWYHYDSTPCIPAMDNMYLMTDADLEWYSTYCNRDFYNRDMSLYPATPVE